MKLKSEVIVLFFSGVSVKLLVDEAIPICSGYETMGNFP